MLRASEELKDLITNGIVLDIFEAEQALALEEFIGKNAEPINEHRFGSFLGSLQIILAKCFILAVTRLYEQPNPRYRIRSIPEALNLLRKFANELPIKRKSLVLDKLVDFGYDMEQVQVMPDKEITLRIVKYFSDNLQPKTIISNINEIHDALDALKKVRDKALAHREAIEVSGLRLPSYAKIDKLVDLAKKFVVVVGNGYLGRNYEVNGRYLHTSDAKRASRSLKRLLIKAGIVRDI